MISVVMTSYNGEKYIEQQVQSILNQTLPVDEIIICDDGSKDRTVEILKKYNVQVIENSKNLGYKLNFKKAMELSHGDYIFLCDQDDVWNVDKVEKMIGIMKKNKNIHVLASSFVYIDANGEEMVTPLKKGFSNNNLYNRSVVKNGLVKVETEEFVYGNYFQGCSLVMDQSTLRFVITHFDKRLPHDWIVSLFGSVRDGMYFYNCPLFQYRIHQENSIGVSTLNQSASAHVNKAYQYVERIQKARDALYVLDILKTSCPEFYSMHQLEYDAMHSFFTKHIEYLKNKRFWSLLFQNSSPYYRKLKTYRGRIMDLIYCFK